MLAYYDKIIKDIDLKPADWQTYHKNNVVVLLGMFK